MKKQLQGIALILFGILLMMFSIIDPWIPIVDGFFTAIAFWAGLVSGIIGLVLSFQKEK